MPRTKQIKKERLSKDNLQECLRDITAREAEILSQYDAAKQKLVELKSDHELRSNFIRVTLSKHLNVRMQDIGKINNSTITEIINTTTAKKRGRPKLKRSISYTDVKDELIDEGYLTAESRGSNASSTRASRAATAGARSTAKTASTSRIPQTRGRLSRSLSRSKQLGGIGATSTATRNNKQVARTPLGKNISVFAPITPKMKANTPPVVKRWPKQNEIAISLQGSPLMVNPHITDTASANIPLTDGRVMSIQPLSGLRMSQLPSFIDAHTMQQLAQLRDNLTKVCEMANHHN